ncbi:hypothetical protein WJX73_004006 [Symbiochloris irregularis]|uniref:Uncharacterized protein n=1 Tax=Symbiochloris irregularis TaxID=706552 RepID=A0AAW1P0R3_9CHLO
MATPTGPGFKVKFGRTERSLSRSQLERVPSSLISRLLLQKGSRGQATSESGHGSTLEILPRSSHGASADYIVWLGGTEESFKVCMDCFLDEDERINDEGVRAGNGSTDGLHVVSLHRFCRLL